MKIINVLGFAAALAVTAVPATADIAADITNCEARKIIEANIGVSPLSDAEFGKVLKEHEPEKYAQRYNEIAALIYGDDLSLSLEVVRKSIKEGDTHPLTFCIASVLAPLVASQPTHNGERIGGGRQSLNCITTEVGSSLFTDCY